MMSQFAMSCVANNPATRYRSNAESLESRLHGLSGDDLRKLQKMIEARLTAQFGLEKLSDQSAMDARNMQRLTARESEVLTLVASGYTRPEVAEALKISRNTAATHVANIYRKLEIESIAEATMLAVRWGIVS